MAKKRPRLRLTWVLILCCLMLLFVKVQAIWDNRSLILGGNEAAAATPTSLGPTSLGPTSLAPPTSAMAADLPVTAPSAPPPAAAPAGPRSSKWTRIDSAALAACSDDPGLSSDLGAKRTQLDARSAELDRRGLLLKTVEQRIDGKISQLQTIQDSLKTLLGQVDQQQQDRLTSLVHIYETMKPTDAAGILQAMNVEDLLPILTRIQDRKMAPILAAMDPDKARAITLALAQNQKLPDGARAASQTN